MNLLEIMRDLTQLLTKLEDHIRVKEIEDKARYEMQETILSNTRCKVYELEARIINLESRP